MSDDRHRFKLVHEHTETEFDYHAWVDCGPADHPYFVELYGDEPYEVRLDAIGRRHEHGSWTWRLLVCNDSDCKGRARHRRDVVEQAAAEWEASR